MNFFYVQFCYVWAGEGGEVGRIFISEFLSLCMVIKTFNDNCILHQTGCVLSYFLELTKGNRVRLVLSLSIIDLQISSLLFLTYV